MPINGSYPFRSLLILLGELVSLGLNICLFHLLFNSLGPLEFAHWEWLTLLLGLCLLLPRNGLDIVALRSAARFPTHLGAWVGVVLAVRFSLSLVAILLFLSIADQIQSFSHQTLMPMSLTLLISSLSPDLAARVQGRFRKAALMLAVRNAILLGLFLCLNSSQTTTTAKSGNLLMVSEVVVCLLWWIDAYMHNAMPSIQSFKLLRRGWRPILSYAMNQTGVRFLRVLSWSFDALLIGACFPAYWAEIAPARRFLMTAVVPLAGWFGVVGPLLASRTQADIATWCIKMVRGLFGLTVVSVAGALLFGPVVFETLVGQPSRGVGPMLALNAMRFLPMAGFQLLGATFTALRLDRHALWLMFTHLFAQIIGLGLGFYATTAMELQLALVLSELLLFMIAFRRIPKQQLQSVDKTIAHQSACGKRSYTEDPELQRKPHFHKGDKQGQANSLKMVGHD